MATIPVTFTAGTYAGASLRQLANAIDTIATNVPDMVSTGPATVLTIDNAPGTGVVSVQLTAGPYQSSKVIVG